MKDLLKNGVIVLLVIGALYIIFLRECKNPKPCLANDEMVIKKNVWDSITKFVNKPPKIKVDTIIKKSKPIIIRVEKKIYISTPKDSLITDSCVLNKSDINVKIRLFSTGSLQAYEWEYVPIIKEINVEKTVIRPQIVNVPVNVYKNGLYVYGTAGGNSNAFLFGGGIDFISKKSTEIGMMYQRYGTNNFYSVKLGISLKF
jgi:hypothetical protein